MTIKQNLQRIQQQIHQCNERVDLLAVSKTKPVSALVKAYEAGQRAFGENYVQEGVEKIHALKEKYPDIIWHFIGPLQSNKTKHVAEHFDWCQTVERLKIAQRLNDQRSPWLSPLNVLIQVNISEEESKSGVIPSELMALAEDIVQLERLQLRGLMAIPKATDDENEQAEAFQAMQDLFHALKDRFPNENIDTLSMGMTNDMVMAISKGATMVRIGTAIFGERDYR